MREARAEKNYISKVDFRKWVNAMYNQFMESDAVVQYRKNYTYVYLRSKVGVAKCNSTDEWDNKTGIAYAWARCTGQPVYYEKKEYNLKAGEWVYITMKNKTRFLLTYITKGINTYCFKTNRGELTLLNKNEINTITPEN